MILSFQDFYLQICQVCRESKRGFLNNWFDGVMYNYANNGYFIWLCRIVVFLSMVWPGKWITWTIYLLSRLRNNLLIRHTQTRAKKREKGEENEIQYKYRYGFYYRFF